MRGARGSEVALPATRLTERAKWFHGMRNDKQPEVQASGFPSETVKFATRAPSPGSPKSRVQP
jgi:hypothetical protein